MDTNELGMQNEKNVTKLVFDIPEELNDYNKTIEFSYGNNEKVVDIITNNEYIIDNNISCNLFISFQVVLTDTEGKEVFKSLLKDCIFNKSINAEDPAPTPEEVSQWNTMITELNKKIDEVDDIKEYSDYAKEQGDYAKQEAEKVDEVVEYVTTTSEQAKETSENALSIAKGRATGYVFDTLEDLELWLQDEANTSKLVLGDNLYIRALGVPDYWWDGSEKQQLETQKVDLKDYVKNTDYATESKAGVMKIASDRGAFIQNGYFYIRRATNEDIDDKSNAYRPIVPANLNYAVGSVKASETQSGSAKMWTSQNENGEIGLNISTEV
jgi:hypothetical protein